MVNTTVQITVPADIFKHAMQISKRESKSIEEVLTDLLRASHEDQIAQHPHFEAILREETFFADQLPQLLSKFEGKYIAMRKGTVIDNDLNKLSLLNRIDKQYNGEAVLIKKVEHHPPQDLFMPSLRWL